MKNKYLAQRKKLYEEAQAFITENKTDEANAKMAEIEKLDTDFEASCTAQANLKAMEDKTVVADFENKTVEAQNLTVVDEISNKGENDVYKNAFAKTMMGQSLDSNEKVAFDSVMTEFKNAVQTTTINEHAVLIPETVRDGIWTEISESHSILDDLIATNVKGNFTVILDVENGETAEALTEDDEASEGSFKNATITLTGCEIARDITISWSMKNQSIDSFLTYLQAKIAEKMGNALANYVINGLGKPKDTDTFKPQPKGIITAIKADGKRIVKFGTLDLTIMNKGRGKLKSGYANGAVYYANSTTIWGELANVTDKSGKNIFIPDVTSGGVGRIYGIPVKEEDAVPAGEILLGNVAKGYIFNKNLDMAIYTEDHVKARTTDYMGYLMADGTPLTLNAFVLLKKSADPDVDTNSDGVYSEAELTALTVVKLKEIADGLGLEYADNILKPALVALISANQK